MLHVQCPVVCVFCFLTFFLSLSHISSSLSCFPSCSLSICSNPLFVWCTRIRILFPCINLKSQKSHYVRALVRKMIYKNKASVTTSVCVLYIHHCIVFMNTLLEVCLLLVRACVLCSFGPTCLVFLFLYMHFTSLSVRVCARRYSVAQMHRMPWVTGHFPQKSR